MNNASANNKKTLIIAIIVFVVLILGGFLLFSNNASAPSDIEESTITPSPEQTGDINEDLEVVTINVEGGMYYFLPEEIRVNQGDRVRIVFNNTDGDHDFIIDELGVSTRIISGGQQDAVEFTADTKGTFQYYCSVSDHKQRGMVGNLVVE